jgi:PAS domain S-box-containing protein
MQPEELSPISFLKTVEELRARLSEAEDILRAISQYEVDAFVVTKPNGEQVYTLRGSEHPYQVIVDAMNEGAATLGTDGTIHYCNPAFAGLLQTPPNQIIGTRLEQYIAPEDRPQYRMLIDKSLRGRSRGEITFQAANGTQVPILLSCSALRVDELQGICLVATDLTEQKRQTQELERRNQELDQFAYVASHDLRAPLRAIHNLASWIEEDSGSLLPEVSKVHFAKLQQRVKRMEQLLEDLLSYSRAGRMRESQRRVDTGALVREVASQFEWPSGFVVNVADDMPVITSERFPLETVFRSLLSNALKHHHNPAQGQVAITAQLQEKAVVFTVSDNGPGIEKQYHERVFQLFQTLKPRDEVEGSGMGLAILKKLVESRGGKVQLQSDLGEGATLHVTWPINPPDPTS